jgi:DtxR family Mn-dependent transcriptional regulator
MNSQSIENYLKAIFSLTESSSKNEASTSAIAELLATKSSSVTDMLQKLNNKGLVSYQKYKGASLTKKGRSISVNIIRKHRLWEVFLVEKLGFKWDQIHDIAEQMEHIQSTELTDRLDKFLEFPKFDPHGAPIPDVDGNIKNHSSAFNLVDLKIGQKGIIVGVNDSSDDFLRYLEKHNLGLGVEITLLERFDFDQSISLQIGEGKSLSLSAQAARNIIVR